MQLEFIYLTLRRFWMDAKDTHTFCLRLAFYPPKKIFFQGREGKVGAQDNDALGNDTGDQ